ncbi:MAG: gluconate 2-dehydrogenase subunit 3 family protein [Bryobacteraceae bacterium]|nr:gluconate 2-dehydrogenase subunit 3 family protein [Bryobacteraceae bacterium]
MDRREFAVLVGVAAFQHQHAALRKDPGSYKAQFLTAAELEQVAEAAEAMLPGARQVSVANHIDLVLTYSEPERQRRFRKGLQAFAAAPGAVEERFASLAPAEAKPSTDAERFFAMLKGMTLFAYYTSKQGIRGELGFLGNQVRGSFPGCEGQ